MPAYPITPYNVQQAKLLVVENQEFNWIVTRLVLQTCLPDVQIDRVSTPQQALTYLENCLTPGVGLPHLILQELYLPRREDGFVLLVSLRSRLARDVHPQLPIFMMSSSTHPMDAQESYRLGASSYLVKGIDIDQQLAMYKALWQFWWKTTVLPVTY